MPTSQNPGISRILALKSPGEQARELAAFIKRGEAAVTEARELRNDLVRKLWRSGKYRTLDELAAELGVTRHVVIDANRKR